MKLTSPDFSHNTKIPSKYTYEGADSNPTLSIEEIPSEAKSLVLIVDDPDAPVGTWDHWIVYDMPVVTALSAGRAAPGTGGKNSWGRIGYGGPCPPVGTGVHRYFFKLYALDTVLGLAPGAHKDVIERAMDGHILAEAVLIGLYEKEGLNT